MYFIILEKVGFYKELKVAESPKCILCGIVQSLYLWTDPKGDSW